MQEKIIVSVRPTFLTAIGSLIVSALIVVAAVIMAILIPKQLELKGLIIACTCILAGVVLACNLISDIYCVLSTKYTFTNVRIIAKYGLISTRISEVRVQDIRGITISKTFLGRILGYASVDIGTAATAGVEMQISDVCGLDSILRKISAERN